MKDNYLRSTSLYRRKSNRADITVSPAEKPSDPLKMLASSEKNSRKPLPENGSNIGLTDTAGIYADIIRTLTNGEKEVACINNVAEECRSRTSTFWCCRSKRNYL